MTDKFISEQIHVLSQMRGYQHLTKEARRDLGEGLRTVAKSEDHAERIIQEVIHGDQPYCPNRGQLEAVGRYVPANPEPEAGKIGCAKCGGRGFISEDRNGYPFSVECECRRAALGVAPDD